jgi:sugar lactone lactonase YvrE
VSAVETVARPRTEVGEGPLWDADEGVLWWVDIKRPAILRFEPTSGAVARWPMPAPIGFLALRCRAPGFVAGLKSGLATVTLEGADARIEPLAAYPPAGDDDRINDGTVDPAGRLWFGTMDDGGRHPTGWLHRYEAGGRPERRDGPYVVTNGPALSAAGDRLYHVDTFARSIWRFAVAADGTLSGRTLFTRFTEPDRGFPDGVVCDAADHLWVAHWGGGRVTRFTPEGTVERVIALPTPQITKCAFGGPNLTTLYVTSAATGRGDDDRDAGALFRVETDVRGLVAHRFAG